MEENLTCNACREDDLPIGSGYEDVEQVLFHAPLSKRIVRHCLFSGGVFMHRREFDVDSSSAYFVEASSGSRH